MTKVVFCFAGTGDPGDGYAKSTEQSSVFKDDVIRTYFRGCQHSEMGGDMMYPDLDKAAIKIREAFEGNQFDVEQLKELLGDGICLVEGADLIQGKVEVESIGLQGFSRGAITAFATAKRLDDLGIPLDIIANQPVPGQMAGNPSADSIYSKFNDLTQCKNIRTATTFIASHNMENGFIHNYFLQQMVAKFPATVQANNWIMPHQSHLAWFDSPIIPMHINREFSKLGYADEHFSTRDILDFYENNDGYFTPEEFSQDIFGNVGSIQKDPLYLEFVKNEAQKIIAEKPPILGTMDKLTATHLKDVREGKIKLDQNLIRALFVENSKGTEINALEPLSDAQASAIVALSKVGFNAEMKQKMVLFVLNKSSESEQFIKIINKMHDTCEYLSHVTKDGLDNVKSEKIVEHSINYKKDVFAESYNYLNKPVHSLQDKKDFYMHIKKAEKVFEANATSIDRGIFRKAMQIIINTLLHVTGLFLIANTLNAALTGNYLFFTETRSTQVVKNASNEVINLLDKTDPSNSIDSLSDKDIKTQLQDLKNEVIDLDKPDPSNSIELLSDKDIKTKLQDLKKEGDEFENNEPDQNIELK